MSCMHSLRLLLFILLFIIFLGPLLHPFQLLIISPNSVNVHLAWL